jgi:hypothetical protein
MKQERPLPSAQLDWPLLGPIRNLSDLPAQTVGDYWLDDRGIRVRFPSEERHLSLHHRVQTGCEVHLASYPMGTGRFSLGV